MTAGTLTTATSNHTPRVLGKWWGLFFVFAGVTLLFGPSTPTLRAQNEDPLLSLGIPPFSAQLPIESGTIDGANGNLHLEIPLGSYPQRGGPPINIALTYDSTIWDTSACCSLGNGVTSVIWYGTQYVQLWGWKVVASRDIGRSNVVLTDEYICSSDGLPRDTVYNYFTWTSTDGAPHAFPIYTVSANTTMCHTSPIADKPSADGLALDGSGYHMYVTNYSAITVYGPDGSLVGAKDSNGNMTAVGSYDWSVTDTLNRNLVTATTNGTTITIKVLNTQASPNNYSTYTATIAPISVHTNFVAQCSGCTDVTSGTIYGIGSLSLPDGTSYSFGYDSGTTSGHYGQLNSMKLPTSASPTQITYGYTNFVDSEYYSLGSHVTRGVSSRVTPDGTWAYNLAVISACTLSSQLNCQQSYTVTKPSTDKTVYKFTLNGGAWPTEIDYYTGPSTQVATETQCFSYSSSCPNYNSATCPLPGITVGEACGIPGTAIYVKKTQTTISLPGGAGNVNATTQYTWDSTNYGNLTNEKEWNFYTGVLPGTPDRTTSITYLSGSGYLNSTTNVTNRPSNVTVTDSGGCLVKETTKTYDGSTPTSATLKTQHDDTNYSTSFNYRGNVTQVQQVATHSTCSTPSTYLNTYQAYDMTGQVATSKDSNLNQTSYDYTDNFYDDLGNGTTPGAHSVTQATNAYVKTITHPTVNSVTLIDTLGYYWGTGQKALSTDPNTQTTYFHFYDPFVRPTCTTFPNSGWSCLAYPNATEVDTGVGITSTTQSTSCTGTSGGCHHDQFSKDSLGRVSSKILVSDPDGSSTVGTTYDSNGRIYTISNPHRSTSSPTDGTETYHYDGLDRTIQVNHADGNVAYTYFGASVGSNGGLSAQKCVGYGVGYPVLSKDEAGNLRQSWTDGFGRLIEVDEPSKTGSLTAGAGTCYGYDLNNNLTAVAQGSLTRSFSYDMLSRLTAATNPESGTTNYYYTASGGSLCSGDPSSVCRRTDAKSVTTTYTYDALSRLTLKSYSDSTWPAYYYYDQTGYTNVLGRQNAMGTYNAGAGVWVTAAWFNYDPVGNVTAETELVNGVYGNLYYSYNLDGSIATIKYPSARVVTYTISNAQRLTTATDTTTSTHINYALGPSSCPFGQSNGMNWACYAPPGELDALKNGASLTTSLFYNNRLQPCRTAVNSGSTTVPANCTDAHYGDKFDLQYSFDLSSVNTPCGTSFGVGADNGNVASITNNVTSMSGRSQQFCYDALNRISSARTTSVYSTGPLYCWGETYGIDSVANLTSILQMSPTYNSCSQESGFSTTVNSHNQDALSCFDAAGNKVGALSGSCSPLPTTYTYDAENRICSISGTSCVTGTYYSYDADGNRMEKSNGTLYWYGPGGEILAETTLTGSDLNEYVFFGGKRIARVSSTGSVFYYFADHLGSSRAVVQDGSTPTLCYDADFYPYGGERTPYTNTCSQNYKFTGKERDSESGLDNFGARYDSSQYGRFMTPDPLGGKRTDPQSLNKYAYVRNNPLNLTDPTGLYIVNCTDGSAKDQKNCNKGADRFEKQRDKDLNSKDKSVRDAAGAWGNRGEDNHVSVTFKSQQQVDADAQTKPGYKTDAIVTPGATPDHQPAVNAEFSESLRGSDLAQTIAHEGSHLEDQLSFLNSYDPKTGQYSASQNFTHFYTEFNAFRAGSMVKPYTMFPTGPQGYQPLTNYINKAYENEDQLMFPRSSYPQEAPPL